MDLLRDRYTTLSYRGHENFALEREGGYTEALHRAADVLVNEDCREDFLRFGSLEDLSASLKREGRIELEYTPQSQENRWLRTIYQVTEWCEGEPVRATMYQADIDKLKAERLLQQRALPDKLRGLPVLMADDDKDCCESTCLLLREIGLDAECCLSGQEAVDRVIRRSQQGEEDYFAIILDWKVDGLETRRAANGREAVEAFLASQPGEYDRILLDIQMPVMNGYEAARAIRSSTRPDAGTIPITAMTANAFAEDIKQSLAAGMDHHLSDPVDLEALRRVMDSCLNP